MPNSLKSHIETLREMFALAANERRMKEADAIHAAIESLSRQDGEAVAELIHSADALTRMVVLPEGMQLGYGTHKLYASPTRASEAGDSFHGIPVVVNPALPPDGWVLVPREPTDPMIDAGVDARINALRVGGSGNPSADTYRAMIAAAPAPGGAE